MSVVWVSQKFLKEIEAKKQGVDLTSYSQNQAMKMSDRPSFNIDAKAARLVEESKMGIFGKTLTLKQAKDQLDEE